MKEQGRCPKCGSDNIDWGDNEQYDNQIAYEFECCDCGFEGKEWANIEFVGFTDLENNEIN